MVQPWSPEHIMQPNLARSLIESQFPDLAPVTVELLGEGFDNTVYRVNDAFVFRFPRREVAVSLLDTENKLLPQLVPILPLAIPEPLFFGQPNLGYPWTFTGYRQVQGQSVDTLSDAIRVQSARKLADFLRVLHQFSIAEAKDLGVGDDTLDRLNVTKRGPKLRDNLQQIVNSKLFDDVHAVHAYMESLEKIEQIVRSSVNAETPPSTKSVLVHGDFHVRNLVVDSNGIVDGIIDWGDTHIGDRAIDLSIVYSFLPATVRNVFYTNYGDVDARTKTLARFKAIYTAALLLLYGHDRKDTGMLNAAKESLRLALEE